MTTSILERVPEMGTSCGAILFLPLQSCNGFTASRCWTWIRRDSQATSNRPMH